MVMATEKTLHVCSKKLCMCQLASDSVIAAEIQRKAVYIAHGEGSSQQF